jgi:sugar phosphate isomerase/epimerase
MYADRIHRRTLLRLGAASAASQLLTRLATGQNVEPPAKPTTFQIACMTLPYRLYPLERALQGIRSAGFEFVAWGTTHRVEGDSRDTPLMPKDATPQHAKTLADRCRDLGLMPLMMFSEVYPEADDAVTVLQQRVRQASAAGIPQVLTFGHPDGDNRKLWIDRLRQIGSMARDQGVTVVIKQHGETGKITAEIVQEIDNEGVRANYDAGNVMDYTQGAVNPLEDIVHCQEWIRSLCIKDHRMFPASEDCGPGLGEIDHYRLLNSVAFTGLTIPLCCENIAAPRIHAGRAEELDVLAKRARDFLQLVIAAVHVPRDAPATG